MVIPYKKLPEDTLKALIDSFTLREGTDYGHQEALSVEQKRSHVLKQLELGTAQIHYDEKTESCTILQTN